MPLLLVGFVQITAVYILLDVFVAIMEKILAGSWRPSPVQCLIVSKIWIKDWLDLRTFSDLGTKYALLSLSGDLTDLKQCYIALCIMTV